MIRISFTQAAVARHQPPRDRLEAGRKCREECGRRECLTRADYEIDHVVAEGARAPSDNRGPLTAADGKLLCLKCHDKRRPRR